MSLDNVNNSIESSRRVRSYDGTDITGGVNLLTEGGGGKACRMIDVPLTGAGTLIVTGLDGEPVTLPAWDTGKTWFGQFTAITGGTATSIVVHW